MEIDLKLIVRLLSLFAVTAIVLIAYLLRPQTISVSIPPEFTYCDKQIFGGDSEYLEIKKWLEENSSGWRWNWHTPYAGEGYYGGSYNIAVFSEFVAVSYKTDWGFPQYIKSFDHGLVVNCDDSN